MDVDFWPSKVHSSKHFSVVRAARLNSESWPLGNRNLIDFAPNQAALRVSKESRYKRKLTKYTILEALTRMGNFTEDECSKHKQMLEKIKKKILCFRRTLDKINALRVKGNITEDERSKHKQIVGKIRKKTSDFQRTFHKLKALRGKANSLSSSFSSSQLNNLQESKKESDCGVSYETYEDGWEDESEDEWELDYESNSDEDDFEGDEDARAFFPCPFCYVEIEIHALCNHLQEEHCFDLRNAVCPLCAANLGKDVMGHFIVQHASSLKRRRKSQRSGIWPGSPATLGRELSSFIGSSTGGRGNAHESAPDPFLSTFLCNAPVSDTKDVLQDKCSDGEARVASNMKRTEQPLPDKDHEQNTEERSQRAAFVQQLVMSNIF